MNYDLSNFHTIFSLIPSKVTTHFNMRLRAYLSLESDGEMSIWCDVNQEWIPTKNASLFKEAFVFQLDEKTSTFTSCTAKARCICGCDGLLTLRSNRGYSFDCENCNQVLTKS